MRGKKAGELVEAGVVHGVWKKEGFKKSRKNWRRKQMLADRQALIFSPPRQPACRTGDLRLFTLAAFPSPMSAGKIITLQELTRVRETLAAHGRQLVFTNGCFDLLHVGHVRYLQAARQLGDALAVGLNGDDAVRELKGPTRPVNPENDRAEVLAALACVDYVVIYPETRFTPFIREVRPQLYAKGGDYTPETLVQEEREAVEQAGSKVCILPLVPGRSTTNMIAAARRK
jgi:rfaE bifunctional protein nucleotidyltransferase chain/domain